MQHRVGFLGFFTTIRLKFYIKEEGVFCFFFILQWYQKGTKTTFVRSSFELHSSGGENEEES